MKAYGLVDHIRCCPGHDPGSKKFDRAHKVRHIHTLSRNRSLRTTKHKARQEAAIDINKRMEDELVRD